MVMSHAGKSDSELDLGGEGVEGNPLVDGPTGGPSSMGAVLYVMQPSRIDYGCLERWGRLRVREGSSESAPCGAKNPMFRDVDKIEEGGGSFAQGKNVRDAPRWVGGHGGQERRARGGQRHGAVRRVVTKKMALPSVRCARSRFFLYSPSSSYSLS